MRTKIVTSTDPHLFYLRERGGELAAQKLGFGDAWEPNASIGVSRAALRRLIVSEAEFDAQQAKKFGGNASTYWMASDAEVITRGLESARERAIHNELYLETFRSYL